MEHFANDSRRLSAKRSILDIGQGFEYASIYGIDIFVSCFYVIGTSVMKELKSFSVYSVKSALISKANSTKAIGLAVAYLENIYTHSL